MRARACAAMRLAVARCAPCPERGGVGRPRRGAGSAVAPLRAMEGVRENRGAYLLAGPLSPTWGVCRIAPMETKTKYRPYGFGTAKTGLIEVKRDGRMSYQTLDGRRVHTEKFSAGDIVAVRIETAADYVERVSGARVAGGAVVGGILLGPLGLALGAGAGVLAKQKSGAAEYLVVDLADGRTVTVEIASRHVVKAREMRDIIAPTV